MKSNYLDKIIMHKQSQLNKIKDKLSYNNLLEDIKDIKPKNIVDLFNKSSGINIIAEYKKKSPSMININLDIKPKEQAIQYILGGVIGISVLTETEYFGGSLDDLVEIKSIINEMGNKVFLLRKDFIFTEYQILESIKYESDTVLLIVSVLKYLYVDTIKVIQRLCELLYFCRKYNIEPLVEITNKDELDIALDAGSLVIGCNNRNLYDFTINKKNGLDLYKYVPNNIIYIPLSGFNEDRDFKDYIDKGIKNFLIGTMLMKTENPIIKIRKILDLR